MQNLNPYSIVRNKFLLLLLIIFSTVALLKCGIDESRQHRIDNDEVVKVTASLKNQSKSLKNDASSPKSAVLMVFSADFDFELGNKEQYSNAVATGMFDMETESGTVNVPYGVSLKAILLLFTGTTDLEGFKLLDPMQVIETISFIVSKSEPSAKVSLGIKTITNNDGVQAPSAPINVRAVAGVSQVTVSWDVDASVDSYNIYWSNTAQAGISGDRLEGVTSPYPHTGLTNGTTYYYVVTAVVLPFNAPSLESPISQEVSATPDVLPAQPSFTAVRSDRTITIDWSADAGVTYNIYWSNTATVVNSDNKISSVTRPYIHPDRTNDQVYSYAVTAENYIGESPISNVTTLPAVPIPANPTGITAGIPSTGNGVEISWTQESNLNYNIYWSTDSTVDVNTGTRVENAPNPFIHRTLADGTALTLGEKYYYIVTAVNSLQKESPASTPLPALVKNSGCTGTAVAGTSSATGGLIDETHSYTDLSDCSIQQSGTALIWQGTSASAMTKAGAESYCSNSTLHDRTDWRLPNIYELVSLVDYTMSSVPATGLSGMVSGDYWSSSDVISDPVISDPGKSYALILSQGRPAEENKTRDLHVRCVTGDITSAMNAIFDPNRFTGTGPVTDSFSGLEWMESDLPTTGTYANGDDAKTACENLNSHSQTDWRLPTVKELYTLIDVTSSPFSVMGAPMDILGGSNYLSLTNNTSRPYRTVNFIYGNMSSALLEAGVNAIARCVRTP